jgi:two-component system cell cycle sensor histidine kinase/response regulator CckA
VRSAPGQGTSFRLYFPRAESAAPAGGPEEVRDERRGTETILVVEDQEQLRGLVKRLLRDRGCTVIDARGADEAIELAAAQAGPVHLPVTDVALEGMNGRDLYARLSRQRAGLKVLCMSGYPRDVLSGQGILEQEDALIQKPFALGTFAARIREALEGA